MPLDSITPACYRLRIRLEGPVRLAVGRLGTFDFPAGEYVYTGSALGGLRQRVERHLRKEKRLRWHIDYLLQYARVEAVEEFPTEERRECALNREVLAEPGARVVAPGFGSSDCRCASHLVYLGGERECGMTGASRLVRRSADSGVVKKGAEGADPCGIEAWAWPA